MLGKPSLSVLVKVKLYELLATLIGMDNEIINKALASKSFSKLVVVSLHGNPVQQDYSNYESNPAVLSNLNKTIIAMCMQTSNLDLCAQVFDQFNLIKVLT